MKARQQEFEPRDEWLSRMEDKATAVICYTMAGLSAAGAVAHLFGGQLLAAVVFSVVAVVMVFIVLIAREEDRR